MPQLLQRPLRPPPVMVGALVVVLLAVGVGGQENSNAGLECGCGGSVAAAVIISIILTLAMVAVVLFIYRRCCQPTTGEFCFSSAFVLLCLSVCLCFQNAVRSLALISQGFRL